MLGSTTVETINMDTNTYTTHSGIQVHEGLLAEQCVDNNLYRGIKKSSLEIPEKTVDKTVGKRDA